MVEDVEQYSLRWNNFHNNMAMGFSTLLQGEDFVDVTLAAGGRFLRAHKVVLSLCSPYFQQLLKDNPCKHPIVILKDVDHHELESLLTFMYQGEVNVRQDYLTSFMKTAEMLQIKGLTGEPSVLHTGNKSQMFTTDNLGLPVKKLKNDRELSQSSTFVRQTVDLDPAESNNIRTSIANQKEDLVDPLIEANSVIEVLYDTTEDNSAFNNLNMNFHHFDVSDNGWQYQENVPEGALQFCTTSRGGIKLKHQGYSYYMEENFGTKKTWRCVKYQEKCKARCVTTGSSLTSMKGFHNHPQDITSQNRFL